MTKKITLKEQMLRDRIEALEATLSNAKQELSRLTPKLYRVRFIVDMHIKSFEDISRTWNGLGVLSKQNFQRENDMTADVLARLGQECHAVLIEDIYEIT